MIIENREIKKYRANRQHSSLITYYLLFSAFPLPCRRPGKTRKPGGLPAWVQAFGLSDVPAISSGMFH
jgi:hypothetical protein